MIDLATQDEQKDFLMKHASNDFVNLMLSHFKQTMADAEILLTWRGTIPHKLFEWLDEDRDR